jgi:hypothetical protein
MQVFAWQVMLPWHPYVCAVRSGFGNAVLASAVEAD